MNHINELACYLIVNYAVVEYKPENDFDDYKEDLHQCQFNSIVMFPSQEMICELFSTSKEICELMNYYSDEKVDYGYDDADEYELEKIISMVLYFKSKDILNDILTFEDFTVFKNRNSREQTVWIRKYFELRDDESSDESEENITIENTQ